MKRLIPLLLFLLLGVVTYVLISRKFLNVISGLLFLVCVAAGLFLLVFAASRVLRVSRGTRIGMQVLIVTTGLVLIGAELFLRYGLGRYQTYAERNGAFHFWSNISAPRETWFRIREPNTQYTVERREFVHVRRVNSLGIPEEEIPAEKAANEYRIFVVGDSFAEGVGASYEESWPRVLATRLSSTVKSREITLFNAAVSGSDICEGYILLRERLVALKPDLVIIGINNTDLADIAIRGGLERFQDDGTTTHRIKPPSWEWLYGISFIARQVSHDVMGLDHFFLTQDERAGVESAAVRDITETLGAFQDLARAHDFSLAVVLHPENPTELDQKRYEGGFQQAVDNIKAVESLRVIDLLLDFAERGLMADDPVSYFWELDAHYKPKGYAIIGKAVARRLLALNIVR